MRAIAVVIVLAALAACGGDQDSCTHAGFIADYIDGATVTDCGHLAAAYNETPAGRAQYNAAHDCVVAAEAAHTTFEVTWDLAGIDSSGNASRAAVSRSDVGVLEGATWSRWLFESGTGKDGKFRGVDAVPCSSFDDLGACTDLYGSLCITCGGSSPITDSCTP